MKRVLYVICVFILITSCGDDDPGILPIAPPENASLKVTNTVDVTTDANNFLGVDDVLTYSISIKNTGNVTLNTVNLTYSLIDNDGTSLTLNSPISFVSSDANSSIGTLTVDETATYTATYTITQSDVDAGGVSNSITANATSPEGTPVSDVSDNGDDTDGNNSNDPTETSIEFDPLIISEFHQFNHLGEIANKYIFNDDGVLYSFSDIAANLSVNIEYDSEGKITFIEETDLLGTILNTYEITYDSDNRITSIGDHNYIYNTDEEFYYDEDSYYESTSEYGGLIYYELQYLKFFNSASPINTITQECSYVYESIYNTITETIIEEYTYCGLESFGAFFIYHDGVNVTVVPGGGEDGYYHYFSSNNPLYTDSINLDTLFVFLNRLGILSYNFKYNLILSQKNLQKITYGPDLPESNRYIYNYNELGLPIDSTSQWYFYEGLESEHLFANYYYQGDEIPD